MKRIATRPRPDWQKKVESQGLQFHSEPVPYWNESAYYEFSADQIDLLEQATNDLHGMCLKAAEYVIRQGMFDRFGIPHDWVDFVVASWEQDAATIYGRFDLGYD